MKIKISRFHGNIWLRVNDRLFGYCPKGIKTPRGKTSSTQVHTRKVGPFAHQDKAERIGYPVYAGMILGAAGFIKLACCLVSALIERGM